MGTRSILAVAAAGLVLAACSDDNNPLTPELREGDRSAASNDRAGDPYGLEELVKLMQVVNPKPRAQVGDDIMVAYLGRGELVTGEPKMPTDRIASEGTGDKPRQVAAADGSFHIFNATTRNQFEVTVPAKLLQEIHEARVRAGLTGASDGVKDPSSVERGGFAATGFDIQRPRDKGALASRGWSNGVDSRVRITNTTSWPRRPIAQFSYGGDQSGCTGTLIGPRHVITAAHCVVEEGTDNWYTIKVTPGRNGTSISPYGSSTISPNPAPGTTAWYWVPSAWLNPTTANPRQWDWAILVLPDRLGDETGWMGYVARDFGTLDAQTNFNRGYPSCDPSFVERPAGCVVAALYGDVQDCDLGGTAYSGPDGWHRLISASCDISRGHSGSPVYHYFFDAALGQTVPVVSMMVVSHTCFTCGPLDVHPNWARRITPGDLGTISFFRQAFP